MLRRILSEIPKLTGLVVGAEIEGDPSYDLAKTGAADAARVAGAAAKQTAKKTATKAKRQTRQARKVPGVARAEGRAKGAVASQSDLAIAGYDKLKADEVTAKLPELSQVDLAKVDLRELGELRRDLVGVELVVAGDRQVGLEATAPLAGPRRARRPGPCGPGGRLRSRSSVAVCWRADSRGAGGVGRAGLGDLEDGSPSMSASTTAGRLRDLLRSGQHLLLVVADRRGEIGRFVVPTGARNAPGTSRSRSRGPRWRGVLGVLEDLLLAAGAADRSNGALPSARPGRPRSRPRRARPGTGSAVAELLQALRTRSAWSRVSSRCARGRCDSSRAASWRSATAARARARARSRGPR